MILLIKPLDFIKLEYSGKDADGNVFDSTNGDAAKTLHGKEGPLLIIFGVDRLPIGLEEAVSKLDKGKELEITLGPEKAFGNIKKNLIRVFPPSYFKSHNLRPEPGLTVYMDTNHGRIFGTVKSVSSGRITVDLNHPLAGKKVSYNLKVTDIIADTKIKIESLLDRHGIKGTVTLEKDVLTLELPKKADNPQHEFIKVQLLALIKRLFKNIKNIEVKDSGAEAKPSIGANVKTGTSTEAKAGASVGASTKS